VSLLISVALRMKTVHEKIETESDSSGCCIESCLNYY